MAKADIRREYPGQPVASVGAVVVWPAWAGRAGGAVLLVERGQPPLEGCWSVPGGVLELGEAAATAAAREVREETGLEVVVLGPLTVVERIERDGRGEVRYHYLIADYLARPRGEPGGPPPAVRAGSDARQARWVEFAELGGMRLSPGLQEVLELAERAEMRMVY